MTEFIDKAHDEYEPQAPQEDPGCVPTTISASSKLVGSIADTIQTPFCLGKLHDKVSRTLEDPNREAS